MFSVRSILLLLVVYYSIFSRTYAQGYSRQYVDSLAGILETLNPDTLKAKVLSDISYGYQHIDPTLGIVYGKRAIHLSDSLKFKRGLATAYAMVGMNYAAQGDFKNALIYETKAIAFYKQNGNKKSEAAMLCNISLIYESQSNYVRALEYAFEALGVYENLGLKASQAYVLDNIGTIYFRKKRYDKAMEYLEQSAQIYQAEHDESGLARNMGNKGMVYHELKEYKKALNLHLRALKINMDLGVKNSVQINLINIGNVLLSQEKYDEALKNYQKALVLNTELGSKGGIATTLGNIGIVYHKMAEQNKSFKKGILKPGDINVSRAIQLLSQSVEQCQELGMIHPMTEFLFTLSASYELAGNFEQANKNLKRYYELNDSINSSEIQQKLANLEFNRELERRDNNLLLKDQQIKIHQLELENNRFLFGFYVVVIALSIVIIFILWRKYQKQRFTSAELLLDNEKHRRQMNEQLSDLKKHSKVLSEIAYMQAHDVRGPVATLLAFAQLFNKNNPADPVNLFILENIEEVTKKLDDAVKAVIMKENEINI